jgi:hypothetical protein
MAMCCPLKSSADASHLSRRTCRRARTSAEFADMDCNPKLKLEVIEGGRESDERGREGEEGMEEE